MSSDALIREIELAISEELEPIMEELLAHICKIAEDALAIARTEHLYQVQTNNLTSSTGFAVTRDGQTISLSAFDKAAPAGKKGKRFDPNGGDEGAAKGREFLKVLLDGDSETSGIGLTMVAGMDYAGFVEDMGLDVLRSAEAHIRQELDKIISKF